MRIVFMGTPQAAVPTLRRLLTDGHEVVACKVGRSEADEAGRRPACRDKVRRGQGRRHQARVERGRQFGKAIVERQVVGGGEIDDASFG